MLLHTEWERLLIWRDIAAGTLLDMRPARLTTLCLFLLPSIPAVVTAQDRPSAFVSGGVSAANMESRTDVALAGAFGYRFSRVVAFSIEATLVPTVRTAFPVSGPVILSAGTSTTATSVVIFPGPVYTNPDGRIVLFTNVARIDIPTTSRRVTPFFIAGGGVANVRRTADLTYPFPLLTPGTPTIPVLRPITERITSSSTDLALTLGGGVGVRLVSSLSLDVDLRIFRLLGQDDRNLGRFGVGVRYAF